MRRKHESATDITTTRQTPPEPIVAQGVFDVERILGTLSTLETKRRDVEQRLEQSLEHSLLRFREF